MGEECLRPIVRVWTATFGAIAVNLANFQAVIGTAASLAALCFTLWQWRAAHRKDKENKENKENKNERTP
jgi:L-lactate permease